MERILLWLFLFGLGLFYLISNGYIDISKLNIQDIDSNTLILIAIGVIVLFLLFNNRNGSGGSHGGKGRKGGRGRGH
jgi:uncharacterized protein HemY